MKQGVRSIVIDQKSSMPPQTSVPLYANFPAEKLTIGAGVAIFHLATERVVVVGNAIP